MHLVLLPRVLKSVGTDRITEAHDESGKDLTSVGVKWLVSRRAVRDKVARELNYGRRQLGERG